MNIILSYVLYYPASGMGRERERERPLFATLMNSRIHALPILFRSLSPPLRHGAYREREREREASVHTCKKRARRERKRAREAPYPPLASPLHSVELSSGEGRDGRTSLYYTHITHTTTTLHCTSTHWGFSEEGIFFPWQKRDPEWL